MQNIKHYHQVLHMKFDQIKKIIQISLHQRDRLHGLQKLRYSSSINYHQNKEQITRER